MIKEPIDLKKIATKIQGNVYTALEELEKDLLIMVRNAKTFNEPGSYIYKVRWPAIRLLVCVLVREFETDKSMWMG